MNQGTLGQKPGSKQRLSPVSLRVAITGASAGLGEALANEYSEAGNFLYLCARRMNALKKVGDRCRLNGSLVEETALDVTDHSKIEAWIDAIEAESQLDIFIINAGYFDGSRVIGALEDHEAVKRNLDTNLHAAIVSAYAVAKHMMKRRRGKIVLISSLAATLPMADAASYSASKAGLSAFGEALRELLKPYNVAVCIVEAGHIETEQTRLHQGRLPMLVSPRYAARRIRHAVDKSRSNIRFPILAGLGASLMRFLPWRVRALFNSPLRFFVKGENQ